MPQPNPHYSTLSLEHKEIAAQIEKLINGLTIEEVNYLFLKIRKKLAEDTKVSTLPV